MTKAIIFDFFGVITLRRHQLFYETAIPNFAERRAEFEDFAAQHTLGYVSADEFIDHIAEATNMTPQAVRAELRSEWTINQPMVEYIRSHIQGRYKTALLSNVGGDLEDYLPKDVSELFEVLIASSAVGMMKPDPAIFELTAERLGVEPAEAIFIDDQAPNCAGARATGMRAIQYDTFDSVRERLESLL